MCKTWTDAVCRACVRISWIIQQVSPLFVPREIMVFTSQTDPRSDRPFSAVTDAAEGQMRPAICLRWQHISRHVLVRIQGGKLAPLSLVCWLGVNLSQTEIFTMASVVTRLHQDQNEGSERRLRLRAVLTELLRSCFRQSPQKTNWSNRFYSAGVCGGLQICPAIKTFKWQVLWLNLLQLNLTESAFPWLIERLKGLCCFHWMCSSSLSRQEAEQQHRPIDVFTSFGTVCAHIGHIDQAACNAACTVCRLQKARILLSGIWIFARP